MLTYIHIYTYLTTYIHKCKQKSTYQPIAQQYKLSTDVSRNTWS